MKRLGRLIVLLALIAVAGCGNRPPMPVLKTDQTYISTVPGSYAWVSFGTHVVADAPAPPDLVKDVAPVEVRPGASVTVKLSRNPDSLTLTRWEGDREADSLKLQTNTFALPEKQGTYVYSIRAEWGNDRSGIYAFIVRVT